MKEDDVKEDENQETRSLLGSRKDIKDSLHNSSSLISMKKDVSFGEEREETDLLHEKPNIPQVR